MKKLILCLALFGSSVAAFADDQPSHWQQWLKQLPNLLDQRTQTSTEYLQNYLQCMDDEQALRNDSDSSIRKLLKDALESGNECSYLLQGLVDELTDEGISADNPPKDSSEQTL